MSDPSTLDLVLAHFDGNQRKFAEAVGVSQSAISQAIKLGQPGPRLAKEIERATGGKFKRHELRPDIWDAPYSAAVA